ncbi:MAG: hypothetical protein H0X61_12430 [Acidimicrobiia bacterium]|nr:hypothetical protein [Acidimicrobiia bacterium]
MEIDLDAVERELRDAEVTLDRLDDGTYGTDAPDDVTNEQRRDDTPAYSPPDDDRPAR